MNGLSLVHESKAKKIWKKIVDQAGELQKIDPFFKAIAGTALVLGPIAVWLDNRYAKNSDMVDLVITIPTNEITQMKQDISREQCDIKRWIGPGAPEPNQDQKRLAKEAQDRITKITPSLNTWIDRHNKLVKEGSYLLHFAGENLCQ